MRALFVLSLRQMVGGKKIWIVALFLSLPLLLLGGVLASGGFDFPEEEGVDIEGMAMSAFLYLMYPQSLCILACLLYGASLLAGEIEDKTLVYLFARRMPRWKVLLGKYLATTAVLAGMTLTSMSLAYVLCGRPMGSKMWLAVSASTATACFTYTAVFCLLGLLVPRRAIPVGLIYAVAVEGFLSVVPAVVNELTTSYYLRSMAWQVAGVELPAKISEDFRREAQPFLAGAGGSAVFWVPALFALGALGVSAWVIHRRQWPLTEGV